jgi:hypothetical protein
MNIPTELIRLIMEYRGSNTFDALRHEMDTVKRNTIKYRDDVLHRIIVAEQNELITYKEMLILFKHKAKKLDPKEKKEVWQKKGWKSANNLDN